MDTLVTALKVTQSCTRCKHIFLGIARDTRLEVDDSIKPVGNMCSFNSILDHTLSISQ